MESEKLVELIKLSGARVMNESDFLNHVDGVFCRTLDVTTPTADMKIEWWTNLMKVRIGGFEFLFDDIEVSGCWPNRAKTNIELIKDGVRFGIIPTEEYNNE